IFIYQNLNHKTLLGEGSFGVVAVCRNVDTEKLVALKMMKEFNNGLVEVYNMKKLQRLDADKHYLVKLVEHFKYKGHICLAYELLSETLFDFLKRRDQRPLDVAEIRQIACQMLMSLKGLKSIGLTHTDIKLDNIMLCDRFSKALKVKLIDFGCAAEVSRLAKIGKIQAVGYRAPEVILGLPITEAIDMWSLGAVLATLFIGGHFYPTVSEYEQLRMIVHVQGLPKDHLLKAFNCFNALLKKKYSCASEKKDTKAFVSLLKRMLHMDPKKRITPSAALGHDFITMKHLPFSDINLRYKEQAQSLMMKCYLDKYLAEPDPFWLKNLSALDDEADSSEDLRWNTASSSENDTEVLTKASLDQAVSRRKTCILENSGGTDNQTTAPLVEVVGNNRKSISKSKGGTKDQITAVTQKQDKITKLTAPVDEVSGTNRTSTMKSKAGTDDHMTAPLVEVVENNRKSISKSKRVTKSQITAVTHQEEKITKLAALLENLPVSDGVTKDKQITAASLNIRKDRPPQEVAVTNIKLAQNITDKTNENMQEDPSDIVEVTTKKKHFRRIRKFCSRMIRKFFSCCRGADDD
uniref:Protein kinase domain-containing protein n=1 Tax=Amphiprion percula TaxID=161767 RepID=A0A3P8UBV6_AMPPE